MESKMTEENQEIFKKLDDLEDKIQDLSEKIKILTDNISLLNINLDKIKSTTGRMDEHISFVEGTYQTLSYPLNVFKESVEKFFPNRAIQE